MNGQINTNSKIINPREQEILEKYDRESVTRHLDNSNINKYLISMIAIFYSLFHLYTTFYPLPTLIQRAAHVGIGCVLIFLLYPASKKSSRSQIAVYDWLWVAAALFTLGYLIYQYDAIMTVRGGIPNTSDIVAAIIAVLVVF
ncbi:MAG TPA: C4-dicarboxylate ABC transporter permease, partial [Pasteurellaceae bacterium]|nr:C4-dicarboxylate ABC transporter permease [Pasteurellaceae bacterium]